MGFLMVPSKERGWIGGIFVGWTVFRGGLLTCSLWGGLSGLSSGCWQLCGSRW